MTRPSSTQTRHNLILTPAQRIVMQTKSIVYSQIMKISRWYPRRPRRFHAYGVGAGKSGTHSLTAIFSRRYRAAHEPECERVIEKILAAANSSIDDRAMIDYVRERDTRLWLEFDSSHLNRFILDILVGAFDDARFILTIRDCYAWLDSFINGQLTRTVSDNWRRLRDFRFRPHERQYAKEEQILADYGLYTLDGYLSDWTAHNQTVLATVPPQRLLVVRTHEIPQSLENIAAFLNIPGESLDRSKTHAYPAREKFGLLSKIDRGFLKEKVDLHCKDLMDRYFPECQGFDDIR